MTGTGHQDVTHIEVKVQENNFDTVTEPSQQNLSQQDLISTLSAANTHHKVQIHHSPISRGLKNCQPIK